MLANIGRDEGATDGHLSSLRPQQIQHAFCQRGSDAVAFERFWDFGVNQHDCGLGQPVRHKGRLAMGVQFEAAA
jgi:hypothetical protein